MHLPFPTSLHGFFQGGHGLRVCFHDAVCPDGSWLEILGRGYCLGKTALRFLSFGQCTLSSIHTQYFRFTGKKGQ